jgi:hypothetical protein
LALSVVSEPPERVPSAVSLRPPLLERLLEELLLLLVLLLEELLLLDVEVVVLLGRTASETVRFVAGVDRLPELVAGCVGLRPGWVG